MTSTSDPAASHLSGTTEPVARHERPSLRMLALEFGSLILLAALTAMLTVGMLELQTSATACIIGESQMCEAAHCLGKITVPEWVADRRLLDRLRGLGVDQAQGFGIHEPCPLSDLISATPIVKAVRSR